MGGVAVHPSTGGAEEDRPDRALTDVQVQCPRRAGCERDGTCLPPLRTTRNVWWPRVDVQVVDVGAERSADPHPMHRQQADERMVAGRAKRRECSARQGKRSSCRPSAAV
jgi:hypothetical protein